MIRKISKKPFRHRNWGKIGVIVGTIVTVIVAVGVIIFQVLYVSGEDERIAVSELRPPFEDSRNEINEMVMAYQQIDRTDKSIEVFKIKVKGVAKSLDHFEEALTSRKARLPNEIWIPAKQLLASGKAYHGALSLNYGIETRTPEEISEEHRAKAAELLSAIETLSESFTKYFDKKLQ